MADSLITYLRRSLPPEIATLTEPYIVKLETGDYEGLLRNPEAQALFGHDEDSKTETVTLEDFPSWNDFIFHRLGVLLADRSKPALHLQSIFFCIGYAALLAFLQSNVTGPPLSFNSATVIFRGHVAEKSENVQAIRKTLLESLSMDGIAAYKLTPNIELLCLADATFTCPAILKYVQPARWAKLRSAFIQQRILSEVSSTLQDVIYDEIELLEEPIFGVNNNGGLDNEAKAEFLLERATIHIHHGLDKLARQDLEKAKNLRRFEFALTGLLGKRTKFQQKDISQLVVLAKSNKKSHDGEVDDGPAQSSTQATNGSTGTSANISKPRTIDLNDDTLLESISFTETPQPLTTIVEENALPPSLSSLNPSEQPQLASLDSTILLALASSITNTSPQDGLIREETLPYATRVLDGGSSNWQVYTQALLVRSRIEGYKSRTVERGLLQLQALVDQVIAETTTNESCSDKSTTFLPRAKESESAPVNDRLRYIFQIASPTRWSLEAELASRWVELGGLRSALDIYERLEMWAEAALCWAATEREDKARSVVRRQLFHAADGVQDAEAEEDEKWTGPPRDPAPMDAPRLYCILGDVDQDTEMYVKAWELSNQRYARAQRSLGRFYYASKDFLKAAEAYSKSLKANQLNHNSWFALGCALLELDQFDRAAEAFSRCVQLDETDAESWSNLAAALLRKEPGYETQSDEPDGLVKDTPREADSNVKTAQSTLEKNRQDALNALKRAASLKHDSYRIWENVLIVSASLSPPEYQSILTAQNRIIDIRGKTDGEKCIDFEILDKLVQHVISLSHNFDPAQPGLQRMVVKFLDENVVPLITGSADLWRLVSKAALWRGKPSSALDAEEKAWRAITSQPGWEMESENRWNDVVEATVRLCDSYESLGPRERTEGMGAGEPVAKDWKFKARSAIRGILGRGKASWEGTDGWEQLKTTMEQLKG